MIPVIDITSIINKGEEYNLDGESIMIIALWFVSLEGKIKVIDITVGDEIFQIKITSKFEPLFQNLMKDNKYFAFYEALKVSSILKKA